MSRDASAVEKALRQEVMEIPGEALELGDRSDDKGMR